MPHEIKHDMSTSVLRIVMEKAETHMSELVCVSMWLLGSFTFHVSAFFLHTVDVVECNPGRKMFHGERYYGLTYNYEKNHQNYRAEKCCMFISVS